MIKFKKTLDYLSEKDPKLGEIINLIEPEFKNSVNDEFTSLVKIIIGQQLSGAAANTIAKRVENTLGSNKFFPKNILAVDNIKLRSCGISNSKIDYIKILSKLLLVYPNYFLELKKNNETDVLTELCKIKGVGIWTASIFAMGTLKYQDIFPHGDATLNKAIKTLYNNQLHQEEIVSNWSPYKSNACRVLWQWVDAGMPKI